MDTEMRERLFLVLIRSEGSFLLGQDWEKLRVISIFSGNQRPGILTGNLPDDFLRLDQARTMQQIPQQQVFAAGTAGFFPTYYQKGGTLTVTVSQVSFIKDDLHKILKNTKYQ